MRLEGRIYFKKFVRKSGNEQDIELLNFVSGYIANKQSNATNFTGNTMLVAQWLDVPPYPHGAGSFIDLLDSFTSKVSILSNNGCVLELTMKILLSYLSLEKQFPGHHNIRCRTDICCVYLCL